MSRIPRTIRAVFFDAVGTLLHPEPSAGDAYAAASARFASRLSRETVNARFRVAFRRQEELDRANGNRTSEEREIARWRSIVTDVLDDVTDADGCFRALYDHFAGPGAWRVESGTAEVLSALAERGLILGLCSNFDHRLHGVVAALPELAAIRHFVISSEVGWKKPAREFFEAVARAAELPSEQILVVGDDLDNDFDGARAAGFAALLFDPQGRSAASPELRIARLSDLLH
jgi:putative hydrolase of the HAD superfamily